MTGRVKCGSCQTHAPTQRWWSHRCLLFYFVHLMFQMRRIHAWCVCFHAGQPSLWQRGYSGFCYVHGNLGYVSHLISLSLLWCLMLHDLFWVTLWPSVPLFCSHSFPWAVEETQSQTCFSVEGFWLVWRGGTTFHLNAHTYQWLKKKLCRVVLHKNSFLITQ